MIPAPIPLVDLMTHVGDLGSVVGVAMACLTLGMARATFYRHRTPVTIDTEAIAVAGPAESESTPGAVPRTPPLALTVAERQAVRELLIEPRFVDCAPRSIHATLLDEGRYLASPSTFYRLLRADGAVRERRNQLVHPVYAKCYVPL